MSNIIDTNIVDNNTGAITPAIMRTTLHTVSRQLLSSNTNFYVSATGNDANDGTSPALAKLTTTSMMMDLSQKWDFNGQTATVNIGAGTFAGWGQRSTTGGGILLWLGAGPGSTTLTNGPNDGVFNTGDCFDSNINTATTVAIDQVKFSPIGGFGNVAIENVGFTFYLGNPLTFTGNIAFDTSSNPASLVSVGGTNQVIEVANVSVTGNGTLFQCVVASNGVVYGFGSVGGWTISGNITVSEFIQSSGQAIVTATNKPTVTGSVTGNRFVVQAGSGIISNLGPGNLGSTFFPGTVDGTVDSSSFYDGFMGITTGSGVPTTTQFPAHGTCGAYKDTSGGGRYFVMNDAGTIVKVALT